MSVSARKRGIRHTIQILGSESVYYEYPSAKENAEVLVMLHGYRGNHRGLEGIAGGLSEFRVIIPDLPGFGESAEMPIEHKIPNYVIWLGDFLRALGIEKTANLLGHSFGTLISGIYASENYCRSLILVNPVSSPALEGPSGFATRGSHLFYEFAWLLREPLGKIMIKQWSVVMLMSSKLAKTRDPELRGWIHREHLETFGQFASLRVAIEAFRTSVVTNLSQLPERISAPTTLIAGQLDEITSIEAQREIVKRFPNARLCEIEGVGHLLHYESPDIAAAFIREHLNSLSN